jgi:hypothetical protein
MKSLVSILIPALNAEALKQALQQTRQRPLKSFLTCNELADSAFARFLRVRAVSLGSEPEVWRQQ